jgi:hypothetical protein
LYYDLRVLEDASKHIREKGIELSPEGQTALDALDRVPVHVAFAPRRF